MPELDYHRAGSRSEAVELADEFGGNAFFLAGGQSLVNMMKQQLVPDGQTVIDIHRIEDLSYIKRTGDEINIGAVTTHADLVESPLLAEAMPALPEMVSQIGDVQVRNMGTIGGDLSQADPRADYPVLVTAIDADITVTSVRGQRTVGAEDFFTGYFETALDPTELLVEVTIPDLPTDETVGFNKFAAQEGDFPLVNAAVWLATDAGIVTESRVVVGCVSDTPVRVEAAEAHLAETAVEEVDGAEVGKLVRANVEPDPDEQVRTEYKKDLMASRTRNAVDDAVDHVKLR